MAVEIGVGVESPPTGKAFIGLLSRVNSLVAVEHGRVPKFFPTVRAFVWLLSCVTSVVDVELRATAKTFPTDEALVCFRSLGNGGVLLNGVLLLTGIGSCPSSAESLVALLTRNDFIGFFP